MPSILDMRTGEKRSPGAAEPTQRFGKLKFLNGGSAMLAGRATRPSQLLCVECTAMRLFAIGEGPVVVCRIWEFLSAARAFQP